MRFIAIGGATRLRRKILLLIYNVILVALIIGVILSVFFVAGRSDLSIDKRITSIGDVLGAGTLLLAFLAALIALQAYAVATGLPDLKVQIWFEHSDKNRPVFLATPAVSGELASGLPAGQTAAKISILNSSGYSAKNPAIVVRLNAIGSRFVESETGWSVIDTDKNSDATSIQWDGGTAYSIHGHSIRRLPILDLGKIRHSPELGLPSLTVEMLAEGGYQREVLLPVRFIDSGESATGQSTDNDPFVEWL
jgi:hypothetical protein